MLRIIMTTSVDYTRLRLGGVSEYAIDFLKRTLVIEPTQRMNDSDCLSHAWIKNKKRREASDTAFEEASSLAALAERDPTRDTERVNDEELNAFASQLSIADQHPGRDEDLDEEIPPEEMEQMRASGQSKRKREQEDELEEEASFGDYEDDLAPCNFPFQPAQQQERMLFGEVTREALQSSGALHWQADAALEVIPPESPNQGSSESHYEGTSQFSTGDFSKAEKQQPSLTHPQTQLETSGAAPSLLGTEFMVGQLNMDSHMAGVSLPDTSSQPTGSQPTGSEPTAPKSKGTREQTPPMETEASGHESTTSSHGLYSATPPRALKPKGPTSSSHEPEGSKSQPKKREADPTESRISKRNKISSERSEPDPTANNGTRGENIKTVAESNQNTADQQARSSATPPQPTDTPSSSTTKASVTAQPTITASPSTNFPPPTTPLGTFTTIPGSVPYPPIHITKRATTFGRMPTNDYIWPDGFDVRVPKHAFDILFHRPHLDNALAHNPNLNWAAFEDISAIISTRTNQRIWVNGVALEKGKDCWLYGHLKTGDIITVFQPLPGAKLTGKESEKLKFRVDMRIGKSKETRNEDEPFTVLEERVQWEKEEARKSRETSLRASQASSNASGGEQAAPKGKDAVAGAKDGGGDVAASAKAPASPAPKPPMPAPEK